MSTNKYAWTITKDHVHAEDASSINAVGIFGPVESEFWGQDWGLDRLRRSARVVEHPDSIHFVMAKGNEILYEGSYVYNGDETVTGLEPLENFGKPIGNCDRIGYPKFGNPEEYQWKFLNDLNS